MKFYPLWISIMIFAVYSTAVGFTYPVVQSVDIPGTDAVTLALGGVLSVGFGDVSGSISNPGSRLDPDVLLFSISARPTFINASFDDDYGRHDVSIADFGNLSYSFIGRINSFAMLAGSSANHELPFEEVYYIPEMDGTQRGSGGEMLVKASFMDSYLGVSWEATEWLCVGVSGGNRLQMRSFELIHNQEESSSPITAWECESREIAYNAGFTASLKMLSMGFTWRSSGKHAPSRIAAGIIFNTGDKSGIGTEVDILFPEDESVVSVRLFSQLQPADSFFLRGGISYLGSRECVSREGFGFSAGVGTVFSNTSVNLGYSWSRIVGERGWYEYEDMDRYEGTSSIISLGVGYSMPEPSQ